MMGSFDYVDAASVAIAMCAFFLAFWEAKISRRHNILSVKPVLQVNIDIRNTLEFELESCGLGPCIIKEFVVTIGSAEFMNPEVDIYKDNLKSICDKHGEYDYYIPRVGTVISPQKTFQLLFFKTAISRDDREKILKNIDYRIIYISIYENEDFIFNRSGSNQLQQIDDA